MRQSVLMLQLDATSRAHLRRMAPRSLAQLRAMELMIHPENNICKCPALK